MTASCCFPAINHSVVVLTYTATARGKKLTLWAMLWVFGFMESGLLRLLRNMVNMICGVTGIVLTFEATGFGWIVKKCTEIVWGQ